MISFLRGTIVDSGENYLAIDVQGVGYEMTATMNAVFKFTAMDGEVNIPTYLAVREDAVTLYGFADRTEKEMFLKLISVSGVGPKVAVMVLSSISTTDLCLSIATSDITTLSKDAKVVSCPLNMDKDLNRINISKKIGSNVVSTSLVYPKSTKNKSFLRKVYEQIQYMVEGTEPRIESMKKDTLARLRAIGKIK